MTIAPTIVIATLQYGILNLIYICQLVQYLNIKSSCSHIDKNK